jgi:uncharacterized protein (TIGR00369 family)
LQDCGECSQSSQIGPHLVQPLSARPIAITLKISAHRLNIVDPLSPRPYHAAQDTAQSQAFSSRAARGLVLPDALRHAKQIPVSGQEPASMQHTPQAAEFDIEEARRVLGEVIAPWVQDLGISIASLESVPPPAATADWQPGATLRMAFSERLCRHGGVVCGQALMALADTAMVIAILSANRGYRPMTTVDQTTHFMRAAASSDVLADARVVRLGRTMSFGRVTLSSAIDNKPVAMVASAFAML